MAYNSKTRKNKTNKKVNKQNKTKKVIQGGKYRVKTRLYIFFNCDNNKNGLFEIKMGDDLKNNKQITNLPTEIDLDLKNETLKNSLITGIKKLLDSYLEKKQFLEWKNEIKNGNNNVYSLGFYTQNEHMNEYLGNIIELYTAYNDLYSYLIKLKNNSGLCIKIINKQFYEEVVGLLVDIKKSN
jgi:hypothetical protein